MQNVYYGFNDRTRSPVGVTALDILASVGTFSTKTTTEASTDGNGLKSYTGFGFEPKAFIPFGMTATASFGDGATTRALHTFGAASQSSEASIWVDSVSGVTTSDTDRRHSGANCIDTAGVVAVKANVDSFDSDGVTLNYATPYTSALLFNRIALGGADLEVSLTQHQMNNTNADESFAHGLSGAPTGVLFFSSFDATSPPSTVPFLSMGIGAWANGNQFGASVFSWNGVTTTDTKRKLANNSVLDWIYPITQRDMIVESVDSTNVNVSYAASVFVDVRRFYMLAIRGAKCQVGTFDCNGSTDPLTISCAGITPKLFMPVMLNNGVDSVNTVLTSALLTIGASDGVNTVSCGITDVSGVTTTEARRYQSSTSLVEYNGFGTKSFEASVAFDGESVVVDPSTYTASSFGQGAFLIIGA